MFFRWWLGELKQAMPASWQAKLQHAMRRVTLTLDGEQLTVGVDENRRVSRLDGFLAGRGRQAAKAAD